MAWTTPKADWATGELVAASDMNAIGENLNVLRDASASGNLSRAVGTTTQQLSVGPNLAFANIDSTNLNLAITTTGGDVLAHFNGSIKHSSSRAAAALFDITTDGQRVGGGDGILECKMDGYYHIASFTRLIQNLSAGPHTFAVQWREHRSGDSVILAPKAQLWVREI